MRRALILLLLLSPAYLLASTKTQDDAKADTVLNQLQAPLYNPFVERYMLDEVKALRVQLAQQRQDFTRELAERELSVSDRAVRYATDTITYFFYLIAAGTSILVLVGWSSMRDIKEKTHHLASSEVNKLISEYEKRLKQMEHLLWQKTQHIDENREEIEKTQEIHSLWLKAGQENLISSKIALYDQILSLKPDDCEALTYKADAVLELGEPQWASHLCQQALACDPDNTHAFYQLACAFTALHKYDEALDYLHETLKRSDYFQADIENDSALKPLHNHPRFKQLLASIRVSPNMME